MTDNVNCLVIIIAKDDNNIPAVQFKIEHINFFSTTLHNSLIIHSACSESRGGGNADLKQKAGTKHR